jgi:hypothetical protein
MRLSSLLSHTCTLAYPNIQAEAQAEINRIVGKDCLPLLADKPNLPYVQAPVNECYRRIPSLPMGQFFYCPNSIHLLNKYSIQLSRTRQIGTTSITATSSRKAQSLSRGIYLVPSSCPVPHVLSGPPYATPQTTSIPKHSSPALA